LVGVTEKEKREGAKDTKLREEFEASGVQLQHDGAEDVSA
jgi:hypothetical protein